MINVTEYYSGQEIITSLLIVIHRDCRNGWRLAAP